MWDADTLGSEARYRLGGAVGFGGMGEILRATDEQIGREVVVKRMKSRPTREAKIRFLREACIQGRLEHPAIVPVHELGVDGDDRPFFVMKMLAGTTLAQLIRGKDPARAPSRQRLLRAFADVCLAIEFAHQRGVIHRDIKPQNIILGDFGEVYVLDWGLAKIIDAPEPDLGDRPAQSSRFLAESDPADRQDRVSRGSVLEPDFSDSEESLTVDGVIVGTVGYLSPEQENAEDDVDGRTDVYALGCVLFEILTRERLHSRTAPTPLDYRPSMRAIDRDIPPELDELCVHATAPDRDARVQTARELGERVQEYLDGDRDLALRRRLAGTHLEAARTAFVGDDHDTAMREAGRALALDPALAGAGELITRLMLEPPRTWPPDLERQIDRENVDALKRVSRNSARGYLGFLCFLPLIFAGGIEHIGYAAAVAAVVLVNVAMLLTKRGFGNLTARAVRLCLGNAALIALLARIGSPLLIAPAVAVLATMALVFSPVYSRMTAALLVAATMSLAILVPWLLEGLGVASPTITVGDSLTLDAVLLGTGPKVTTVFLVLYVAGVITCAAGLAFANRSMERSLRGRLHLQAWRLRQLVS